MLDDYLRYLKGRLDEDRIAKLYGAFSKLMDAPRSVVKQGLLIEALDKFHEVSRIPQQGVTGDQPNAQLRCMAFVGMAASYMLLQDQPVLIAEKMVEAVQADANTARQWLGDDLVREIISKLPPPTIVCPKCGFQNPAGSQFCNRDGYPFMYLNAFLLASPLLSIDIVPGEKVTLLCQFKAGVWKNSILLWKQ